MFDSLPKTVQEVADWEWPQIEPYYKDLASRQLSADNVDTWLADWTRLDDLLSEAFSRARVATTCNTADAEAERRYHHMLEAIYPPLETADTELKKKLLASGLEPKDFAIPLRNMRAEAALFREANLPLLVEQQKLSNEYNKLVGAQTVVWEGKEVTLVQLQPVYQNPDRAVRERAWRLEMSRWLQDRAAINDIWRKLFDLRQKIAANADCPDFRAYTWKNYQRFDYTPDDCMTFHKAIEEVVVPAAQHIYEKRRKRLGVDTLRPWDLDVDPWGLPPLRPFEKIEVLTGKAASIFRKVHPGAGQYFDIMVREGLLDLDNRKNKAPGGYCTGFAHVKRPFIFMNAVGVDDNVRTLLHEAGHAFHGFESLKLLYSHQRNYPIEFAEVASMSMELLASPYLTTTEGGYYSDEDAARSRVEHLEGIILFWPYMAVVDAFQHWAYTHPSQASNPANCDTTWAALWGRYMKGVDWSGLEDSMMTGWQRKQHIYRYPFYYVEYGLARLGSVQVWANALENQSGAVENYFKALALGGTATLPELFAAAGARFAFDSGTLSGAVALVENTIDQLDRGA